MIKNQYIASIFIATVHCITSGAQSPTIESAENYAKNRAHRLSPKHLAPPRFKWLFQQQDIQHIKINKLIEPIKKAPQPAPLLHIEPWLKKDTLQQEPTGPILLYNANVPIKHIWITDIAGATQNAIPHNPTTKPANRALWDIPINDIKAPYTLFIVANNKQYAWAISSFHPELGQELMIGQKLTPQGVFLILRQFEEKAADSKAIIIPTTSETSITSKNF